MKILVVSPSYPPDIGHIARDTKSLFLSLTKNGHWTYVSTYRWEKVFPLGIRHILYLIRLFPRILWADRIISMDMTTVGFPTAVLAYIFHKQYIVRCSNDMIFEKHVERTEKLIKYSDFYQKTRSEWSMWERTQFRMAQFALRSAKKVIFTTLWQKNIIDRAYSLDEKKSIVPQGLPTCPSTEDHIESSDSEKGRVFIAGTRSRVYKNIDLLKESFADARVEVAKLGLEDISIDTSKAITSSFSQKIQNAYAVISVSCGDPLPQIVCEALKYGVPAIVSTEQGLPKEWLKAVIVVDYSSKDELIKSIVKMSDPKVREQYSLQAKSIPFRRVEERESIEAFL
jgi:hypothetical protein